MVKFKNMNSEIPEVSIITPTFNRGPLLSRMIDSVIAQTFENWELLIMDDGSTDNSKEIILEYNDERIKFFRGENSGAAQKRNNGVNVARAKNIIFLDSDDEVKSDWLRLLLSEMNRKDAIIVSCGLEFYDSDGKIEKIRFPNPLVSMYENLPVIFLAGSFMIKKKLFLENGGYDENLKAGQHTDLLLQLLPTLSKNKDKICSIKEALVKIHSHGNFKIRKNYSAMLQGNLLMMSKHEKLFKSNPDEYYDYLSTTGVLALRTNNFLIAKKNLLKAFLLKPYKLKSHFRLYISWLPGVRSFVWRGNNS